MDFLSIAKQYKDEYIQKTTALLQFPTLLDQYRHNDPEIPFGKPIREALDFMLLTAENDGFKVKDIDHYAGQIEMGEGEEILGVLGHLDVVPTGGNWNNPPFSATLENGRIYARGSMDDKGPTMAAYIAFRMIQDLKIPLKKRVRLILGCDEETGMRGVKRYLEKEAMPDLAFAPDADFPLIYGEKGIASFDISGKIDSSVLLEMHAGERYNVVPDECTVILNGDFQKEFQAFLVQKGYRGKVSGNEYTIFGKNAHAAWPHLGVNAIFLMTDFLKTIISSPLLDVLDQYFTFDTAGKKLGIDFYDEEMKDLTLNLAKISLKDQQFMFGCNIRYPKGYQNDEKNQMIEKKIAKYGFVFTAKEDSHPHYVSPKDPFVQTLYKTYQKYSNDFETPMLTIGGGTYARTLKKAVAFGPNFPGREDLAHQANEYLIIDDMIVAAAIYAECIVELAG